MHHIDTNYGEDLPDDLVPDVTEIQDDACNDDFCDGEPHVVIKVSVEVLAVITEVTPPGKVVWVAV